MRNLKKVLALVLALVMSLSLVTIANAADFSDDADINYDEAVDVMVAAGIIDGIGNNQFDPNGTLTREQAAKLITYMLLGDNSEKLGTEGSSFKDVATTRWSAPAIEYCATMGIIDGAGDGNFYPAGKLTGYAFAKMLLTALGYKSDREGFTGASWTINVATKALSEDVRLDKGLEKMFGSAEISRQEAAQMALNAIKAPLVEYDTTNNVVVNGVEVQINGGGAKFVTTTIAKQQNISDRKLTNSNSSNDKSGYTVEFGERYLPKLELKKSVDVFERPSYTWYYDKEEIGTYIDTETLYAEFTTEVTGKDLYDTIGKSIIDDDDYKYIVAIDGITDPKVNESLFDETAMNKNNKKGVGDTGNGTLTQVFVNSESKIVRVAIINTYLARAKGDYSEKKDEVTFNVYAIDKDKKDNYFKVLDNRDNTADDSKALTVSGEDFAIKDVKEDDAYLVNVAGGEIQALSAAEVVGDVTLTAFKKNSNVVADGTTYNYAHAAEYDFEVLDNYTGNSGAVNLKEKSYNLYLDQYGYLLGADLVTAADNYVFISGIEGSESDLSATNRDANAIFLDGTMERITFNVSKSSSTLAVGPVATTWCTYTKDSKGIYTLTEVDNKIDTKNGVKVAQNNDVTSVFIDVKHVSLLANGGDFARAYGNDESVYLTAELKTINSKTAYNGQKDVAVISSVSNVVTGVKNASLEVWNNNAASPTISKANALLEGDKNANVAAGTAKDGAWGTYLLYKSNGYIIAAVTVADDSAASKNLVYVTSSSVEQESYNSETDEWTWTREVAINGEKAEIKEVSDSLTEIGTKMKQHNWYEVKYNAKGEVVLVTLAKTALKGNEYVDDIRNVETAINDKSTVLYEASTYEGVTPKVASKALKNQPEGPSLKGSTLFVSKADTEGFHVDENVNIVFRQMNDNKWTTEYDEGVSKLQSYIEDLNADAKGKYNYEVSAILEGGSAKVVVIRDLTPDGDGGETPKEPTGDLGDIYVDLRKLDKILVNTTASSLDDADAFDAVIAALKDAGYTLPEPGETDAPTVDSSGDLVGKVVKGGITRSYKWTHTDKGVGGARFTIDGVEKIAKVASTDTIAEELGWPGSAVSTKNQYVRYSTDKGETWTYVTDDSSQTISDGMEIETGYYKVTVTGGYTKVDLEESGMVTPDSGSNYYALKDSKFMVLATANGTGVKVNDGSDGWYFAYGSTFADMYKKCGASANGIVTIAAIEQVALTIVNDTVGSEATTVKPVAYATGAANHSGDIGSDGTMMYLDGATTAVVIATTFAYDGDHTVNVGYVEVCAPTAATTGTGDGVTAGAGTVTTSLGNTGKVIAKNGSTFTLTVSLPKVTGAHANGVKATPTVTTASLDVATKTNTQATVQAGASTFEFTVTVGATNITVISVELGNGTI